MRHDTVLDSDTGSPQSRALTIVAGPSATDTHDDARPLADFVAQLIACDSRLPAYRRTRRAAPSDAAHAYREPDSPLRVSLDRVV